MCVCVCVCVCILISCTFSHQMSAVIFTLMVIIHKAKFTSDFSYVENP